MIHLTGHYTKAKRKIFLLHVNTYRVRNIIQISKEHNIYHFLQICTLLITFCASIKEKLTFYSNSRKAFIVPLPTSGKFWNRTFQCLIKAAQLAFRPVVTNKRVSEKLQEKLPHSQLYILALSISLKI